MTVIDNRSSLTEGLARLHSQKGRLLRGRRGWLRGLNRLNSLDRLRNWLGVGGFGEVFSLDCGLSDSLGLDRGGDLGHLGGSRAAANVLLSLVAVLAHVLFHDTGGMGGTLFRKVLELVGLGADDLLQVVNLLIDDLTVADVHERSEVSHGHGDDGQTPKGNESDEPVASEGSSESLDNQSVMFFILV